MKPWSLCRPVVADWHSFDEEQDPKPDRIEVKNSIRIHIKVLRILNPGKNNFRTKVSAPDSTPAGLALPAWRLFQTRQFHVLVRHWYLFNLN